MRARTLASASSPGVMATLPALTSHLDGRGESSSSSHANVAQTTWFKARDEAFEKLAALGSRGGRLKTSASRSCTGVCIMAPSGALRSKDAAPGHKNLHPGQMPEAVEDLAGSRGGARNAHDACHGPVPLGSDCARHE